jgi:alpha-glucosidase
LLDAAPASGRIYVELPLDIMPLYVRAGSVLPVEEAGRLSLRVYAPDDGETRESRLYCDAGDGYGPSLVSRFTVERRGSTVEVRWTREGQFPWPYRAIKLKLYGAASRRAEVDGKKLGGLLDQPFDQARFEL